MNRMYYDTYTGRYTIKMKFMATSDRYLLTHKGTDNYTEKWKVRPEAGIAIDLTPQYLNISYSKTDQANSERIRQYLAARNNVVLVRLVEKTIPADEFDNYYQSIQSTRRMAYV